MPVNSFDDYPMSWKPSRDALKRPLYQSLADRMQEDIRSGALAPNTKLPPQRELADYLDLNPSTVTKAYRLCEMRGLIQAVVGRGTFVSPHVEVSTSVVPSGKSTMIEMGSIRPFYEHNRLVRDLTADILKGPFSENLFDYGNPVGSPAQRETAASWLRRFGLPADARSTLITGGIQNGLAAVLMAFFEPGDWIVVDPYTYPNFIGLANQLHLQLIPVKNDGKGMIPAELESACIHHRIRGIYLIPSGNNPTNIRMSEDRKARIGEIIRKRNMLLIEDDNYAAMFDPLPVPLAHFCPDQAVYLGGVSKPFCCGLRVAFLHSPAALTEKIIDAAVNINLKVPSLNVEVAVEAIRRGLDRKIMDEKRNLAIRRNEVYQTYFPDARVCASSYYQWLPLRKDLSGKTAERELAERGVCVFGAERFSVSSGAPASAIRVSTCSPSGEEELRKGLEILRKWVLEA